MTNMEISECTNIDNINIINEVMLRRLGHVRSMNRNSLETEMDPTWKRRTVEEEIKLAEIWNELE